MPHGELILLHGLLMPLLQNLHLLLLLVTPVNRLTNRSTHGTTNVLTAMVMAQHVPRTDAMGDDAFLILTLGNVLPQTFHSSTMRSYGTLIILVGTFGCMPQQEKTLLLVTENLLTIRR